MARMQVSQVLLWMGDRFYVALAIVAVIKDTWDQFIQPFNKQLYARQF